VSSGSAKQIKIWIIVVAMAAAVGFYFWRGREGPVVSGTVKVVCVETGKVFEIKRGSIPIYPGTNPETGHETLMPAEIGADGVVRVHSRARAGLAELKELNKCVDPKTLVVTRK